MFTSVGQKKKKNNLKQSFHYIIEYQISLNKYEQLSWYYLFFPNYIFIYTSRTETGDKFFANSL